MDVKLYLGDCLEILPQISDKSIDAVIADPPYGTTACKWDNVIPLEPMWKELKRIIKPRGIVILSSKQPFTSILVLGNLVDYRYELIWEKDKGTDFGNANRKPLNAHENIMIFYQKTPTYNKQMKIGKPYTRRNYCNNGVNDLNYTSNNSGLWVNEGYRTPISVIKIARDNIHGGRNLHPTQKPVALMEYLIKTYTNESETVLDFCMGSGTTGVAAKRLNRNFIGIEKEEKYFEIAKERIENDR